jgi:caa(3)-type oxidase subunit IV
MAETHELERATAHHGSSGVGAYVVIFAALVVFTAISFIVNSAVRSGSVTPHAGFTVILGVAICKAVLVAMFFMHLKFDWGRLYFMIFPVMILGALLVVVLLPDIVLAWHHPAPGTTPTLP